MVYSDATQKNNGDKPYQIADTALSVNNNDGPHKMPRKLLAYINGAAMLFGTLGSVITMAAPNKND
jgi:hypothetical protein